MFARSPPTLCRDSQFFCGLSLVFPRNPKVFPSSQLGTCTGLNILNPSRLQLPTRAMMMSKSKPFSKSRLPGFTTFITWPRTDLHRLSPENPRFSPTEAGLFHPMPDLKATHPLKKSLQTHEFPHRPCALRRDQPGRKNTHKGGGPTEKSLEQMLIYPPSN